jgi:broad specificity phosphatase PhoE
MAAIYLIRHGQASFGKADYDKLSDKGIQQAEILGNHWQSSARADKFYAGDLLRHGQTLKHFSVGHHSDKTPTIIHSGLNEFDHVDILTAYNPKWHSFAEMSAEINQLKNANYLFQKEFSKALNRWLSGDFDLEYKESWSQFKIRCVRALQDIIHQELANNRKAKADNANKSNSSNDILVFTSGGTISTIIQHILQLSDDQALVINQQLRNTSVSKLLFSEKMLSVDYYNNYSHLELAGPDWITFR